MKYIKKLFIIVFIFILFGCANKQIFKVTFLDKEGNVLKVEDVKESASATAPDVDEIEGYDFIGWNCRLDNITSDAIITPVYELKKFTVVFFDENDNIIDEQTIEYGKNATAPNNPVKENYNFAGWDKEFINVKEDLFISPIFENKTFNVVFLDGEGNELSNSKVQIGKNATAPLAPTKEGYDFKEWDANYNNVQSDLIIKPVFIVKVLTVTFTDDSSVLKTEKVKYNENATPPTPTVKEGFTFSKWDKSFNNVTDSITIKAIYIRNEDNFNYTKEEALYWIQTLNSKFNKDEIIFTSEEIRTINNNIINSYDNTKVVDVTLHSDTMSSAAVSTVINNYSNINSYNVYDAQTNSTLTSTQRNAILNNRNINNIPTTVTIKYGIVSDFCAVRSYPTNCYSNSKTTDRFQETGLNVGDPVAIYHHSLDNQWLFIQAHNYNGWVESKYIAVCTKEELKSFNKPVNNIVIIADYVMIENHHVRMGQSFPLVNENSSSYTISFPTRLENGNILFKNIIIDKSNDYNKGYLPYTTSNVFIQAFKMLGIDYSWGDKYVTGRDCSSTQNAVYSCFGFIMPRNTSNQRKIPTYGISVNGITSTYMKQNCRPGTLIFSSGHVMMYIGEDKEGVSYLFHNTSAQNGKCIIQALDSYGGSRIIGLLKLYK